MKKVKITVLRATFNEDLALEYGMPGLKPCSVMKQGQVFYAAHAKPDGFCDGAWRTIYQYVFALANGARSFYYNDWIRQPGVAIACCNDGLRPVFFKLEATDEECVEAARIAGADSFIRRLPQGYDTMVTGDGANLSQGQRQLLGISRAAVADPPVMILDEATSSIDTRTELKIQHAFTTMMDGRTTFIVAHRLSTIREADVILVMRDGSIVEMGSHEALLQRNGFYAKLYNSQFAA